jgi:hypothetical protein
VRDAAAADGLVHDALTLRQHRDAYDASEGVLLEIRDLRADYDQAHLLLAWAAVYGLSATDFGLLALGSAHIRGMP